MKPDAQNREHDPVVIIGTGLAGYTVARELRKLDREVPIVLVTRDDGCFYSKPMLSNALAMKKQPAALASFDASTMAAQLGATVRVQCHVERILPAAHEIVVSGEHLKYRSLVLALGADARRPGVPGSGAANILSINDLSDYARFRHVLEGCKSVAILGAGLIGCEFSNDLVAAGYVVSLIDPAATPLSRLLPEKVGMAFAKELLASGIHFYPGRSVATIERAVTGYRLHLSDETHIDADIVISAIGLAPRTALASAAGIQIDQGIRTDAWCRTSVENIFALGDCAAIDGKVQPYVLPIMHAARALARTLFGEPTRVQFPIMPIIVKTPAIPAVIVPSGGAGEWLVEEGAADQPSALRAIFRSQGNDRPTGFALLGAATEGKASLIKTMTVGTS
ncbi:NAD(P)/FAD-dependent oxidoreductase [Burkholderia sp. S171]|uniref:NAD(P)/FAD-dependent oxidoreductase n=1 Tax=Burkholderia sp. S171 TaxID=1641860 RepID=UPI00131DAAA7|nr:FAD-dependent oxidoreductase [Burkholderia sp. S171]